MSVEKRRDSGGGYMENSINTDYPLNESGDNGKIVASYSSMNSKKHKLEKRLGLSHGFFLMVGLILGSGIFISPGLVAADTSSMGMMLIIWVAAGLIALMGSLCYCELGCIFKMSGGNYANIFNVYGNIPAFLCAWTTCLVIDPASISAIALTIGIYITKPFYETDEEAVVTAKLVAFGVILVGCFINCFSVKLTNKVQSIFAIAQISSVIFVVCLGIWQLSMEKFDNFHDVFNGTHLELGSVLHIGVALFGGLWSFDGWAGMNNVIEEIHNVERNLLLTVITSFPFVIFCYIMVNISFLTLLSHKDMSISKAVGVDFVQRALGQKVSYAMMVLVGLSSYGTLNGTLFACPRLTLAAAREGHMPFVFSLINQNSGSPVPAILLLTFVSCLMLVPSASSMNSLILLFSQAQWIMYGSSILGVVILRLRQPDLKRPYKVFIGVPIFMTLVSVFLVIVPFFRSPLASALVFVFILLGLPVYLVFVYYYLSLPSCFINFGNSFNIKVQRFFNLVPCSKQDL